MARFDEKHECQFSYFFVFFSFKSNSRYEPDFHINRYRRKRPKVDASIFDSALSHTRRSDASEKKRRK